MALSATLISWAHMVATGLRKKPTKRTMRMGSVRVPSGKEDHMPNRKSRRAPKTTPACLRCKQGICYCYEGRTREPRLTRKEEK